MQRLLLLLSTLYVAAIKILFVKEYAGESTTGLKCKRQKQQCSSQQPDGDSYLADLPDSLSRLVTLKTDAVPTRKGPKRSKATAVTVPLRCDGDWKYAKAVLQIVDGSTKEFPSDMTETEADIKQLIDICRALQLEDLSYAKRVVDALCVGKHAQIGLSDSKTYLKMWLWVFCATCDACGDRDFFDSCVVFDPNAACGSCKVCGARDFVPDIFWLDLFQALRGRDPAWYLHVRDLQLIGESPNLTRKKIYNRATPFIRAVLELLGEREFGLTIPHSFFLEGNHLAGRFSEIVDMVRYVSNEDGVIFLTYGLDSCITTRSSFNDRAFTDSWDSYMSLSIRIMEHKRLFVAVGRGMLLQNVFKLIRTFFTKSVGQVTDLFLNIYPGTGNFWNLPSSDSANLISTLATLPLRTLWIYSFDYVPSFTEETTKRLYYLQKYNKMHNTQVTVWEHRPLTRNEAADAEQFKFGSCSSCNGKNQPCFVEWWKYLEEYTCRPAYILPLLMKRYLCGKPFILAGLAPSNDAIPTGIEGGDCLPAD